MKGQRVAYIRVSTVDQNTARQLEGQQFDEVFEDKASGKDAHRPALESMLRHVRKGDTLVVHSMDRLARNLDDLRRIVAELTGRGVRVEFFKEALTFGDDASPMSKLLLSIMGAFAEFERALILERQREGIAVARASGKYKGRKPKLIAEQVAELQRRAAAGEGKSALAREFGLSRETLYSYLRQAATSV